MNHDKEFSPDLNELLASLEPHDHLCLIYNSYEEWVEVIVPFILSGFERNEKCIYVADDASNQQVKTYFLDAGLDLSEAENRGQFNIFNKKDTPTWEGCFDPDFMIAETEKALSQGYSALRVTGEISSALHEKSGSEKLLGYEAKLNRDFFPGYSCLALCQYNRSKHDSETIKGAMLTHPLLIWGTQAYRNLYYIEPDEYLNHKKSERQTEHWLNNLEREKQSREILLQSERKYRQLFEDSPISLWEEDFSAVKQRIDELKNRLDQDLRSYLVQHPDLVQELAGLVQIIDVNRATINLYKAKSKEEFFSKFNNIFLKESHEAFIDILLAIAESEKELFFELPHLTLEGELLFVQVHWSVASDHESTYSRVSVSVADITEHKKAEESLQKRLAELETLYKVSSALRSAETLEEMLPILLDEVLAAINTEAGAIWLYHTSNENLHFSAAHGWFSQLDEANLKSDEGVSGKVFMSGKPYITSDLAGDPLVKPDIRTQIPPGWAGTFLPLQAGQKIVGVLAVSVPSPREISCGELKLLSSLAAMAGTAIQRISLYEETVYQLHKLEATRAVDKAITTSQDFHLTMDVLLKEVVNQLHVNSAAVFTFNPQLNELEFAAGQGFKTNALEQVRLKPGENALARTARERRTIISRDSAVYFDNRWSQMLAAEEFRCCISVPLIVKNEVKGVLAAFESRPYNHEKEWLDFLEALADQAAIAVYNSQLFDNLKQANLDLSLSYEATIEGWSRALDLRDHETEGHSKRVTEMAVHLAKAIGVPDSELIHIRRGALLHDIGKVGIPDSILLKTGKLTNEEWAVMREHPKFAYELLAPISYLRSALEIPYCHHEKWDSSGYPRGLKGEEIPLAARIFTVVDVFDALTSNRPYRLAWKREAALDYIRKESGRHFDPQAVKYFLEEVAKEY